MSSINGGSQNSICQSQSSFIGVGTKNSISTNPASTIINGLSNTISGDAGQFNSIINGNTNEIGKNSKNSFIGSGYNNYIFSTSRSTVLHGQNNGIVDSSLSTIVGGERNLIQNDSNNIIGGGSKNNILNGGGYNVIGGGFVNNVIGSCYSSILGGTQNTIAKNSSNSSITGGKNNTIFGLDSAHVIGSNINAYASNATFVENLYVAGNLSKATGTFRIPYPGKNTSNIVHSLVETNTPGDNIYRYRYTTAGKGLKPIEVFIQLPDYFTQINNMEGEDGERPQVWISPEGPFNFFNANGYVGKSSISGLWGVLLHFEPNQMINRQDVWAVQNTFNVLVIGTRSDRMALSNWAGDVVTINSAKQTQEFNRGMI